MAAIRAAETARPDRLFADPLAGTFAAAGGLDPGSPPGDRRAAALRVWVVGRTVFLDGLLARASQQGCRQVVLLGAGFDARAFRLPWPPGTRCFEVDTPDVLGPKDEVLAAAHATPGCERVVVPCDLRGDWPAALRTAGLDPARPAAWIAEGLLVYLAPAEVDRLLAGVTALSAPGSWLGLTMTTRDPAEPGVPRPGPARLSRAPADPARWLARQGWAADVSGLPEVLRAHGRPLPERARAGAWPRALLIQATLANGRAPDDRDRPGHAAADQPQDSPASRPRPAAPARQPGKPRRRDRAATVLVAELKFSAVASQALVAFTIEFDNEAERQLPHRTTWGPAARSGRGPWLVSLTMWANFMRFLPAGGAPLRDMADLVPLTNLAGLQRWGYVELAPAGGGPAQRGQDAVVRPTARGRRAQEIWAPLAGVIGERWRERFGAAVIDQLTGTLRTVAGPSGDEMPAFLPVSGVYPAERGRELPAVSPEHRVAGADLPTLLSRALMSFRAEFERTAARHGSALSLPVSANVLRVLSAGGVPRPEVPRRAGVSREAASVSVGLLERQGYAVTGPDPAGGRGRDVRLTPRGEQAQEAYHRVADGIEDGWRARFGDGVIDGLAGALRALYAGQDGAAAPGGTGR